MDESQGYDWDDFKAEQASLWRSNTRECPQCGGVGMELGVLGDLQHFRCHDCGAKFNVPLNEEVEEEEDEEN